MSSPQDGGEFKRKREFRSYSRRCSALFGAASFTSAGSSGACALSSCHEPDAWPATAAPAEFRRAASACLPLRRRTRHRCPRIAASRRGRLQL
jgi:hypothetical protein